MSWLTHCKMSSRDTGRLSVSVGGKWFDLDWIGKTPKEKVLKLHNKYDAVTFWVISVRPQTAKVEHLAIHARKIILHNHLKRFVPRPECREISHCIYSYDFNDESADDMLSALADGISDEGLLEHCIVSNDVYNVFFSWENVTRELLNSHAGLYCLQQIMCPFECHGNSIPS